MKMVLAQKPTGHRLKTRRPTISLVIPAKNEARNLQRVLPRIPPIVDEIVMVDGHSTDHTERVARELRPDIRFVRQDGAGKGNALRCGFEHVTGDIVVMIDADGSMAPEEIPRFVAPLLRGYDFVKGSRFLPGGGTDDMETHRRLGNRVFVALVNRLYAARYTDLCYGYNAFWRRTLDHLDPESDGFEIETELNAKAARSGLKVAEVPSYEEARSSGDSHLNAVRDGLRILKTILRCRFRRATRKEPGVSRAGITG